jgi:hypothetical protein
MCPGARVIDKDHQAYCGAAKDIERIESLFQSSRLEFKCREKGGRRKNRLYAFEGNRIRFRYF